MDYWCVHRDRNETRWGSIRLYGGGRLGQRACRAIVTIGNTVVPSCARLLVVGMVHLRSTDDPAHMDISATSRGKDRGRALASLFQLFLHCLRQGRASTSLVGFGGNALGRKMTRSYRCCICQLCNTAHPVTLFTKKPANTALAAACFPVQFSRRACDNAGLAFSDGCLTTSLGPYVLVGFIDLLVLGGRLLTPRRDSHCPGDIERRGRNRNQATRLLCSRSRKAYPASICCIESCW